MTTPACSAGCPAGSRSGWPVMRWSPPPERSWPAGAASRPSRAAAGNDRPHASGRWGPHRAGERIESMASTGSRGPLDAKAPTDAVGGGRFDDLQIQVAVLHLGDERGEVFTADGEMSSR